MTVLVVGLNHRTADLDVLERAVVTGEAEAKLTADVARSEHVTESALLSTCNRVELYADVTRFHAAVTDLTELLSRHTGIPQDELLACLYVHYQDRAVHHLFTVACGLDSVAIGEPQIVGQVRGALHAAEERGTLGRSLGDLFRRALHTGKRARSETSIDHTGASIVHLALDAARTPLGSLAGRRVLVIGAGAMAALACSTLAKQDVTDIVIANRTAERAERLAEAYAGRAVDMAAIDTELPAADLVVACTGSVGPVLTRTAVERALPGRGGGPLCLVDLALPRDIEPAAGELADATLIGLEDLGEHDGDPAEVDAARAIVRDEVASFIEATEQAQVAPLVAALRGSAQRVVEREMDRLHARVPDLDDRSCQEVARTVHRIVEKLLHTPTVRVKQLATGPEGGSYASALSTLFDLDPATPEAVARVDDDDGEATP
ncbi:MAG: glutamyl-tRNA reductase [Streptosporangiales bacterium]